MNELYEKLDLVKQELDNLELFQQLDDSLNKIKNNNELMKKINKYNECSDEALRLDIYNYEEFMEYKKLENEVNLRDIDEKVSKITDNYTILRYPRDISSLNSLLEISDIMLSGKEKYYNDLMYKMGLGIEVSPLNPFIKDYYSNLKGDELNEAEINVLGNKQNLEKLVSSCEEKLKDENITEQEKDLLLHTIEDTNYQINTQKEIINLIQSLKVKERNKNAK